MHDCEEFRERIAAHIVDREDISLRPDVRRELVLCQSCADFCIESREAIDAISSVEFQIAGQQWIAMNSRLRMRIIAEGKQGTGSLRQAGSRNLRLQWVAAAAALAAVFLVSLGLFRLAAPLIEHGRRASTQPSLVVDHNLALDPVTVDFLEQSELLLRNVMKLEPDRVEDLEQARQFAVQHLAGIEQRKQAASEIPPVVTVMDTYETVLRDLRNVDERNAAEDIVDIQSRIQRNGLIANMKAFQPNLTLLDVGQ